MENKYYLFVLYMYVIYKRNNFQYFFTKNNFNKQFRMVFFKLKFTFEKTYYTKGNLLYSNPYEE